LEVGKNNALANLVMGLSSQTNARSVTEVSLSNCYHYQYSSISDALNGMFEGNDCSVSELEASRLELEKKICLLKRITLLDLLINFGY
jgi:hypothetical protein